MLGPEKMLCCLSSILSDTPIYRRSLASVDTIDGQRIHAITKGIWMARHGLGTCSCRLFFGHATRPRAIQFRFATDLLRGETGCQTRRALPSAAGCLAFW